MEMIYCVLWSVLTGCCARSQRVGLQLRIPGGFISKKSFKITTHNSLDRLLQKSLKCLWCNPAIFLFYFFFLSTTDIFFRQLNSFVKDSNTFFKKKKKKTKTFDYTVQTKTVELNNGNISVLNMKTAVSNTLKVFASCQLACGKFTMLAKWQLVLTASWNDALI